MIAVAHRRAGNVFCPRIEGFDAEGSLIAVFGTLYLVAKFAFQFADDVLGFIAGASNLRVAEVVAGFAYQPGAFPTGPGPHSGKAAVDQV